MVEECSVGGLDLCCPYCGKGRPFLSLRITAELQTSGVSQCSRLTFLGSSAALGRVELRPPPTSKTRGVGPPHIELTLAICDTEDEPIGQTECSVLPEMTNKTSAGHILFMLAPPSRAVWLLHSNCDGGSSEPTSSVSHPHDNVRLRRVLDYISANLTNEITLTDLSKVACLSTFHFARTFTQAFGISPHHYISHMRLEKAMAEIVGAKLTLAQIALNARFSSQASFTRAFRRATGVTPGEYRRCRREHHGVA